jgi:hypothetical protein
MNTHKLLSIFVLIIMSYQKYAHACSFLQRYGANSYITNTPLFFKQQKIKKRRTKPYEPKQQEIIQKNNRIAAALEEKNTTID